LLFLMNLLFPTFFMTTLMNHTYDHENAGRPARGPVPVNPRRAFSRNGNRLAMCARRCNRLRSKEIPDRSRFLLHMQCYPTANDLAPFRVATQSLTFFFMNRSARVYVRQLASALDVDSTNLLANQPALRALGFCDLKLKGDNVITVPMRNTHI
jgi:hypothetical protein